MPPNLVNKRNRLKAIIFMNITQVAIFAYTVCLKITVSEKGVNALDICLVRNFVMLLGTGFLALHMRVSFKIAP